MPGKKKPIHFEKANFTQWKELVEKSLKGASFEKKCYKKTLDGLKTQPLYTSADVETFSSKPVYPGFPPGHRGSNPTGYVRGPWNISQDLIFPNPTEFNNAARSALDRGLTGINMVLDRATRSGHDPDWAAEEHVGVGGISLATTEDLDRALDGIDLSKTSLFIRSGASALPFAALLVGWGRKRGKDLSALRGCIEMDPIGVISHEGRLPHHLDASYDEMAHLTRWAVSNMPRIHTICIHTRSWHEGGGSPTQELAFTLATALEYIREMVRRGLSVEAVAPRIRVAVSVGSQFFVELSKLRALRLLWSKLIYELDGSNKAQYVNVHVKTGHWNKTIFDPYTNILRTTVESLAAVMGGCDSLQVGAFDEIFRMPDEFSRRLARNVQLILQKECGFRQVIDPAGGSWYVESLTNKLATEAWSLFQEVEKKGGMTNAMKAGFPQEQIIAMGKKKSDDFAHAKNVLVGTNKYADSHQEPPESRMVDMRAFQKRRRQEITFYRTQADDEKNTRVIGALSKVVENRKGPFFEKCVEAVMAGATIGEVTRSVRIQDKPSDNFMPIPLKRIAIDFEQMRIAVLSRAKLSGLTPSVHLLNMGELSQYKARSEFSSAFFQMAGLQIVRSNGLKTVAAALQDVKQSDALFFVICSTDDEYPKLVPELTQQIKKSRSQAIVILAGYPKEHVDIFTRAGVDEFIHLKCDALAVLKGLLKKGRVL